MGTTRVKTPAELHLDELLEERREALELDEAEATIESLRADLAFERDHGSEAEAAALRKQVANQKAIIADLGAEIRRMDAEIAWACKQADSQNAALARLSESEGRYRAQVAALRKAGAPGGKENGPGAPSP